MSETEAVSAGQKSAAGGQRTYCVGDPLPNALGAEDLMRALNLAPSTFYAHQRAGKLKRFEFRRPIGAKRYSGALVKRYLENSNS